MGAFYLKSVHTHHVTHLPCSMPLALVDMPQTPPSCSSSVEEPVLRVRMTMNLRDGGGP